MSELDEAVISVLSVLQYEGARSAVKYLSEKRIVKATRRFKPSKRNLSEEILLTIGRPNYAERKFVKLCQKAGQPFPIKNVQKKLYPAKKAKSKK